MSDKLIAVLKKSKLFNDFNQGQLEEVIAHLQPKSVTLEGGNWLYERGKPSDRCWLIQSGHLTVKRASLRTPFRKMIYHEGSVTGIQGLADPGSPRAVTMIAEDNVELVEITHEGIARLDKETQILLWRNISRLLLRKLSACLAKESLD